MTQEIITIPNQNDVIKQLKAAFVAADANLCAYADLKKDTKFRSTLQTLVEKFYEKTKPEDDSSSTTKLDVVVDIMALKLLEKYSTEEHGALLRPAFDEAKEITLQIAGAPSVHKEGQKLGTARAVDFYREVFEVYQEKFGGVKRLAGQIDNNFPVFGDQGPVQT